MAGSSCHNHSLGKIALSEMIVSKNNGIYITVGPAGHADLVATSNHFSCIIEQI
ncbi:hypothetical protein GJ700_32515 [Duganella sp. FT92W]|uniref:Uncharacterized protein n=1 Tax=Pseudoduganella rivuli TaxID=2666085 RepID=A0A7X2IV05_9BURK|nr:hypothetical protein [Pseudoduganella rivuli]MRV76445.1 hypothetical protein [Pseudoduganella rivuli]